MRVDGSRIRKEKLLRIQKYPNTCGRGFREESIITRRSLATVTGLISFPNNLTGGKVAEFSLTAGLR